MWSFWDGRGVGQFKGLTKNQCDSSMSRRQVVTVIKSSLPLDSRLIYTYSQNVVEAMIYYKGMKFFVKYSNLCWITRWEKGYLILGIYQRVITPQDHKSVPSYPVSPYQLIWESSVDSFKYVSKAGLRRWSWEIGGILSLAWWLFLNILICSWFHHC